MKISDLKWALGELVSAALHPQRCDCITHTRLNYRVAASDGAGSTDSALQPRCAGVEDPEPRPDHLPSDPH